MSTVDTSLSDQFLSSANNNNIRILYITFGIIFVLIILWIILVIFSHEDPLKILDVMNNLNFQLPPAKDVDIK